MFDRGAWNLLSVPVARSANRTAGHSFKNLLSAVQATEILLVQVRLDEKICSMLPSLCTRVPRWINELKPIVLISLCICIAHAFRCGYWSETRSLLLSMFAFPVALKCIRGIGPNSSGFLCAKLCALVHYLQNACVRAGFHAVQSSSFV